MENKYQQVIEKTINHLNNIDDIIASYTLKINKILPYLSLISIVVLFTPILHKNFANTARILLIIIMFSRPLRDLLPKIKILSSIVAVRKSLGIVCGVYALIHGIGYFILSKISIIELLYTREFWIPTTIIGSGIIAAILMLPPLLTSNNYSIKKLGKIRKKIQQISYLLFPMAAIHIALSANKIDPILLVIIYLIIYFLAYKKGKQNTAK